MRAGLGGRGSKFRSAAQSLGEGKKNRENRFPGARSRGPLRPGSWTKRGRDTPRVERRGAAPRAWRPNPDPAGPGHRRLEGRGAVDADFLRAAGVWTGQDGKCAVLSTSQTGKLRPSQLLGKLWRRLYRGQSPHLSQSVPSCKVGPVLPIISPPRD